MITKLWTWLRSEKTPLTLAVLAQAYTVSVWLAGLHVSALTGSLFVVTALFAMITAVSLDLIVVTTTFAQHRNVWSWMTALAALVGSCFIVIDLFYGLNLLFLHTVFPILVFLYSQHLAESKHVAQRTKLETLPTTIIEYRMRVIKALLQDLGYDQKTRIRSIVGGKTEVTSALIDQIADELGLRNTALQSGEREGTEGNEEGI